VTGALVSGYYLRCGRCRIPNPYNILREREIRRKVHGVYYMPYFLHVPNFVFSPFLTIFNFYIIKKITLKKLFATYQFGKR
jgi:hypothetical protein